MLRPIITYLVVKKVKTFKNEGDPFCALLSSTQKVQHRKKCYWNICILAKLVQQLKRYGLPERKAHVSISRMSAGGGDQYGSYMVGPRVAIHMHSLKVTRDVGQILLTQKLYKPH